MNLERIGAHDAARAYLQQAEANKATAAAARPEGAEHAGARAKSRGDSVTLSESARALATARDAVKQAPDVREAKVADIKQRVADGTYSVPAHVLARNMLSASQK